MAVNTATRVRPTGKKSWASDRMIACPPRPLKVLDAVNMDDN